MFKVKKKNAIFGRYPCCDLLNEAIRELIEGETDLALNDIIHAIAKANGYFYDDVAIKLGLKEEDKNA